MREFALDLQFIEKGLKAKIFVDACARLLYSSSTLDLIIVGRSLVNRQHNNFLQLLDIDIIV